VPISLGALALLAAGGSALFIAKRKRTASQD
jgi:hypothetical protein